MQFDNTEQSLQRARAEAALPPAPPPKPERSAWGAIGRGIAGGAAQLLGQAEQALTIRGMEERRAADDPIRIERDRSEQRRAEIAQQALDYERGLRPDAATATTAENVVYGLSRSLTKAIGATVAAGPVAGATVFGSSEAAGTFDDLRREGVDPTTAGRAAAVAGVAGGVGVVLPMMGSTLGRTAALYVAGGPGGFMAQQAATRSILERADYGELAKKYDPLDPVGLTLSALIPLPFAGMGAARNIRAARSAAQDVPGQAPRADQAGGNAEVPPVQPGAPEASMTSEAIDAAMVHNLTLARAQADAVPAPAGVAEMFRGPVTENPNFKAWFGDSKVVLEDGSPLVAYHGTQNTFDEFRPSRKYGEAYFFSESPSYANTIAAGEGGNVLPTYVSLKNPKVIKYEDYNSDAIDSAWTDNRDGLIAIDENGVRQVIIAFRPEQIKSAIGNSGRFDPDSGSLTDPVPDAPMAQAVRPEPVKAPEQVEQARATLAELQASGKPIEQFVGDRPDMAPDVKNLLIGLYEAGANGARADRLLADYARTVTAQRLRPTADVAADVVEAARAGKTVTAEPAAAAPAAAPTPETAAAQMTADRIATLETQNPDMVVRIEDDGRQVTLAEELQRIRQEAAEGSDVELGALDAELVKVAAECAISSGAV